MLIFSNIENKDYSAKHFIDNQIQPDLQSVNLVLTRLDSMAQHLPIIRKKSIQCNVKPTVKHIKYDAP